MSADNPTRAKCVFADCNASIPANAARDLGWKNAIGHGDVWVCPSCVAKMFDKVYKEKEADDE